MDKKEVLEVLKKAREASKKRNFSQSIELIINLKNVDLKKAEQQIDFFVTLHFFRGRKVKVCALVGPEMVADAKNVCDKIITQDEFANYAKNRKLAKKLAKEFDFFIAQANLMARVAGAFGKFLGPKGKMPNPKAGCVVAPKTPLKPLIEKLQKTVKLTAKTIPIVQCLTGNETMSDEEVADNVLTVYDSVVHHLPGEENNVKSVLIKLTMGKPVRLK
jgi:large subunit ribosomal protein L1